MQSPIPSPDGNVRAPEPVTSNVVRGDWKSTPIVIRGWAYPLTWLYIGLFVLAFIAGLMSKDSASEKIGGLVIISLILAVFIWLNRALRLGTSAAWTVQLVASVVGLLAFPLGTLIHGYILSQWFKPETKAWFGRN
jgi:hypothetical protein